MDKPPPTGSGRRRTGRRLQESLSSNLGPVLDLSAGGARILSHRDREGDQTVELFSNSGTFSLEGKVVWHRKLGFRKHEIGVEFTDVDEDAAQKLSDIARAHAVGCQWHDAA